MSRHRPASYPQESSVWRQQIDTLRQQARSWWNARSLQERKLLRICAAVITLALIWVLGLQPALKSIAQSRLQLPLLHADAAQVQAYILEAQALRRQHAGRIAPADLAQALGTSLQRAGLQDSATMTEARDPDSPTRQQWEVALFNASAARVMAWLAELPYLLRLQITLVELERANVQGRDRPGHVSGRILVRQTAKEPS